MVTARVIVFAVFALFFTCAVARPAAAQQPVATDAAPVQRARPPSLTPPLVVTAMGGSLVIAGFVVWASHDALRGCIDLLGDGCEPGEGHDTPPPRGARAAAGVGGGVLFVGLGWLLACSHARARWRSRQLALEPTLELGRRDGPARVGLGLRGVF